MTPWIVAGGAFLGAVFLAWGDVRLALRWPLAVLSLLLAVISVQLFRAARGHDGFHDLGAFVAQFATVLPALAGVALVLVAAALTGHSPLRRDAFGLVTVLGLLAASVSIMLTLGL
ncbi:MAG: hypothetical protein P3W90_004030 [Paracoccus sp. (in: a-proteobacteria)]|nr:hypothetical protein [Paracoccus sp. (in: a-proteobacteria)]